MANLVIANDEPLAARQELKETLARIGHVVVGETSLSVHALVLARSLRPDAVLLDAGSDDNATLSMARALAQERLAAVVFLASAEQAAARPTIAQRASDAGVLAFVRKPARSHDLEPALAIAIGRFREIVALETQVRTLTERMEARQVIGRAKALLMEQGLSERDAFSRIQAQSQALNKPAHEIARALLLARDVAPNAAGGAAKG